MNKTEKKNPIPKLHFTPLSSVLAENENMLQGRKTLCLKLYGAVKRSFYSFMGTIWSTMMPFSRRY